MPEDGRGKYRRWRCAYPHFSETTRTTIAKTRMPLSKWVLVIERFKTGILARGLGAQIGVTSQTAGR